eukprot:3558140-Prymnesium_polylepis.2
MSKRFLDLFSGSLGLCLGFPGFLPGIARIYSKVFGFKPPHSRMCGKRCLISHVTYSLFNGHIHILYAIRLFLITNGRGCYSTVTPTVFLHRTGVGVASMAVPTSARPWRHQTAQRSPARRPYRREHHSSRWFPGGAA